MASAKKRRPTPRSSSKQGRPVRRAHPTQRAPIRPPAHLRAAAGRHAGERPAPDTRQASTQTAPAQPRGKSKSPKLVLLTLGCGVLTAAAMAFGNPVLWTTAEQHAAAGYAEGTDKEDYAFISNVAGDSDASQLVVLGEYKAISQDDDPDRAANLALAAEALDGAEIKPGETFSANEALGDTAQDERYRPAATAGGAAEAGQGAGVSQASTALYIAAVKADMEVAERHPHAAVCDFAPIGLDAALAYGEKDLRIKNASDVSIFIRADAQGQTVEVKLYGTASPEGETVDAASKIVDRADVPAREAFEDPQALGLAPEETVTRCTAESYRVRYRDGAKVSDELLATDVYWVYAN